MMLAVPAGEARHMMRNILGLAAVLCVCAGCAVPGGPPVMAQESGPPVYPQADVSQNVPNGPDAQQNCQEVSGQAEIDGQQQPISGLACRQPDGTWRIQQPADADGTSPYAGGYYQFTPVYEDDPFYWGPPFAFGFGASFVFVDRFHHFHHIDHVHFAHGGFGHGGFHGGRHWAGFHNGGGFHGGFSGGHGGGGHGR
jgi:putative hemolysin